MADLVFRPAGPVAKAFMEANDFVKVLIGPLGSGKTSAAVVDILGRAMMQAPGPDGVRRVRVAMIRNTFSDLKSTTLKSWETWVPSHFGKLTIGTSPIVHRIQTPDLDLEAIALPLDKPEDVRKLLSLELTFAWIDEAREVPREILDALTGRVGRYPSRLQGGCTWSGILLTSNPSDSDSWLAKLCNNPPEGYAVYRQPSGRSIGAENLENLPANYYKRIAAGKDEDWLRVYCDGEWGFVQEGRPVFPSFRDSVHVAQGGLAPVPGLGLVIGADFGLTPAAVIAQPMPDGRIHILDELVTEDTGIIRFAQTLSTYMRQHYGDFQVVAAVGDPAGSTRGHDERTVFEILNLHTPWRWKPAPTNEITMRLEAVNHALGRAVDGRPGFQVSPRCSVLRKGFNGGYCFKRVATGNGVMFHDVPVKNQHSHVHDALQYALLGMGGAEAVLNRPQRRKGPAVVMARDVDYPLFGNHGSGRTARDVDYDLFG